MEELQRDLFWYREIYYNAGLLWIRSIHYLGSHVMERHGIPHFFKLMDAITLLDSFHLPAYEFTGVIPIEGGGEDLRIRILERGIQAYPDDWKISLFLSMILIDTQKDYSRASLIMRKHSQNENAPPHIRNMHNNYARRHNPAGMKLAELFDQYLLQQGALAILFEEQIIEYFSEMKDYPLDSESILLILRKAKNDLNHSFNYFSQLFRLIPQANEKE
jgi:hypothetical protein